MKQNDALYFARELRKDQTTSEIFLWKLIRKKRLLGLRFLRQYRIEHSNIMSIKNYFFVDLYCHELKLIIEVDGEIHLLQKEYDQEREDILTQMGYNVYRIKNEEVKSIDIVQKLETYCKKLLLEKNNDTF
ncbi:MAG: DUF559 domain-containing protein [Saprospiraceae bacterium]|uniref:DUF559 domain-containing protein n=1 Tax=Candidatus Defluviibacterium haderslevense TaxID=2981993 RepID=A0A9D7S772_9BACT|nr:DUF559 domain-containing protein [Candidatus Defluviibacterium haderslevense]